MQPSPASPVVIDLVRPYSGWPLGIQTTAAQVPGLTELPRSVSDYFAQNSGRESITENLPSGPWTSVFSSSKSMIIAPDWDIPNPAQEMLVAENIPLNGEKPWQGLDVQYVISRHSPRNPAMQFLGFQFHFQESTIRNRIFVRLPQTDLPQWDTKNANGTNGKSVHDYALQLANQVVASMGQGLYTLTSSVIDDETVRIVVKPNDITRNELPDIHLTSRESEGSSSLSANIFVNNDTGVMFLPQPLQSLVQSARRSLVGERPESIPPTSPTPPAQTP